MNVIVVNIKELDIEESFASLWLRLLEKKEETEWGMVGLLPVVHIWYLRLFLQSSVT